MAIKRSTIISVSMGILTFIMLWGGKVLWCSVTGVAYGGGLMLYSCIAVTPEQANAMMGAQALVLAGTPVAAACGSFTILFFKKQMGAKLKSKSRAYMRGFCVGHIQPSPRERI